MIADELSVLEAHRCELVRVPAVMLHDDLTGDRPVVVPNTVRPVETLTMMDRADAKFIAQYLSFPPD